MKYQGKLISKDKQVLLIKVQSSDIFEAEKKILKRLEEMVDYIQYDYRLEHITSVKEE